MSKKKRKYHCTVVNEGVKISLQRRATAGLRSKREFFVQCDQAECQYVDENKDPCPLRLSLFSEEIEERKETARLRREEADYF